MRNLERNRRKKIFLIAVLVFSIFSLSVGFAAFSTTLIISSSASVKPNSDSFSVALSSGTTIYATEEVDAVYKDEGVTTSKATIVNGAGVISISNIEVGFSEPGQTALYSLALTNNGEYRAYLNSVVFEPKTCNYGDDVNSELAETACEAIDVSLAITYDSGMYFYDGNVANEYFSLEPGEIYGFELDFNYSKDNWIDGNLNVIFGDIKLYFSSVEKNMDSAKNYVIGDSVMFDPVNDNACMSGDTCYEWNVIEHSDASSNDITLITTDVMNSLYYEAYSLSEDEFVAAGISQLLGATTTWSVGTRHLTEVEYNSIIDYYGCSWPGWLGMSCTSNIPHDWFYSGDYFFLDGNKWVGYDGGGNGAVHDYSTAMDFIGVRPVITISKDKLV